MSDNLHLLRSAEARIARRQRHDDRSPAGIGGGGPYDPIDARVTYLENDMREVKATLVRLEPLIVNIHAQMPFLATRAELVESKTDSERLRGEVTASIERLRGKVMIALAAKPGRAEMWGMAIALFALVVAAMAAGAIYLPFAERLLHVPG